MELPRVISEHPDFLLIDKPAGWLVHGIYHKGEAKHNEETLVDWLIKRYPEIREVGDTPAQRGGIVHRLDRETSGIMVIARTQEAFLYLKKLFQTKEIQKTYQALVWGRVKDERGVINKPISIIDGSVKRTVFKGKMTREAITEYRVLKRYTLHATRDELTLLEVSPKTGRTHQIRVHFSSLGHPLVGDKLYGKKRKASDALEIERHFLHAARIEFIDTRGTQVIGRSELPKELKAILKRLSLAEE